MSGEEIHDYGRVDAYAKTRRHVAWMRAAAPALLAGAVASLAVSAAIWVVLPKFTVREVVVDHVVQTDVTVDHVVPKDVPIDIPQIVITRTPQERAFADSPAYADAEIKGRIIASPDGISLAFDTGKSWVPTNPNRAADSAPFVGDLGMCSPIPGNEERFHCVALHNGVVTPVPQRPLGRPT